MAPKNRNELKSLTAGTKLPKLGLVQFDGNLKNWPMFAETFKRVIHDNSTLTLDQKVQYLVGRLSGRAKESVSSVPVTGSNYEVIWKRLTDKYEDEYKLGKFYFDQMWSFECSKTESFAGLENFLDKFVSAYEAAQNLLIANLTDFFCGAKNALDDAYKLISSSDFKGAIEEFAAENRIVWKLNPPGAPHFGGLWESMVKGVKRHLFRTIGSQILSLEEFQTLVTQIEAVMNSRPLTTLSEDPSDLNPLTLSHFLIAKPVVSFPKTDIPTTVNLVRPQLLENLVKSFWQKWKKEYLHELQMRQKWNTPQNPVAAGKPVLIIENNTAPLNWPVGVITQVFPGEDGTVRVVEVKTKKAKYVRPVVKICPLPE